MRDFKGKSIIALPSDYVVIDTETTGLDYDYCNLIEVSALKFKDGKCVDNFTSLIQPPMRYYFHRIDDTHHDYVPGYVDDFIAELTGITNEMLSTAPTAEQVIPKLLSFIDNCVLIGHNANFDINFLYDAAINVCGTPLRNDFIDTLRIARKVFPEMAHHRLSDVTTACHVDIPEAHRAEADCKTTAACYEWMRTKILEESSEAEFAASFKYDYGKILSEIRATAADIDATNPLYGKVVVFTGALSSMTRKEAFQLVVNWGGIPSDNLNAKTNFLVIGNTDFAQSVKEGKTNKMKKAEKMVQKGLEISIISESAFFEMISDYQQS